MNKKIIALAIPILLIACSPSYKEKNKVQKELELSESSSSSGIQKPPVESSLNENTNSSNNNSNGNIPGSKTEIPEIKTLQPQVQTDTVTTGGGTKKKKPIEQKEILPAKEIIQTADIKIQVNNLDRTADTIELLAKKYGAYISNANQESSNNGAEAKMMIRVRQENFNALIKELMHQSVFTNYKNIRTDDVTAEYVDIEARLKMKKEVESRYIDLLRNRAHSMDEIFRAENEIRVIHEEIESKTGRLNFIKDQVAWSTINIDFYQQTSFTKEPEQVKYSWWSQMGDAAGSGWNFMKALALGLTYIWPVYVFLLGIYFILKKYVFQKTKKNA